MRTAVIYARFSSHRQGEQSIEGQVSEARKYALSHDLNIIHEYIDRAVTGRTDDRVAFQEMLRDAEKKRFDVILLWKIDRFGRNREEIAFNKHRLKKAGVSLIRVAEDIPDTPEGVILESVLEGMAEYYSLQLSQNVSRGMRNAAEKGQIVGGPTPFGYSNVNKRYVLNENATDVKRIFDMYESGSTIYEILDDLNRRGVKNHGRPMHKNSLYTILRNERYTGVYVYKDIRREGIIPKIIEHSQWEKVQTMMQENRRAPERAWGKSEYLLTDKLKCGLCGRNMIGESGTNHSGTVYHYYACTGRKAKACKKKAIRQDLIEPLVIKEIAHLLHEESVFKFVVDATWEHYLSTRRKDDEEQALRGRLSDFQRQKDNLIDAIKKGLYDPSVNEAIADLNNQMSQTREDLDALVISKAFSLTRDYIEAYLKNLRDLDIDDPAAQKVLIKAFINSIFVFEDKVILAFNYGDDEKEVSLSAVKERPPKTAVNEFVFFENVLITARKI